MKNSNLSIIELKNKLKKTEQLLINKSSEVENLKHIILSNINHEIRTPLNAIMGFSSLLLNKEEKNSLDEEIFLQGIYSSSERLLNTIEKMLEAAKIQSKEITINNDEIILEDLLEELKTHFQKEKEKKEKFKVNLKIKKQFQKKKKKKEKFKVNLKIKNDINKKKVKINTDQKILKKILINLIDNALKFTDEGFVIIGYTLKNNSVQFHVIDTGIGIPKNKNKQIFNNFEQIDNSIAKKYSGLGIGLSISNNLTNLLGGKIILESEPNIGSFFTIDIPVSNIEYLNNQISDEYLKNTNFTWPKKTFYQLKNKSIINKQPYINFDLNNDRINIIS